MNPYTHRVNTMNNVTPSTNKDELISADFEVINGYQAQVIELQQTFKISVYAAATFFVLGMVF